MFKNKKVLVTGGTGLIGRPLVRFLVQAGAKVRVSCLHEPVDPHPDVEYIRGNLVEMDFCGKIVEGMQCVFHLAASRGSVGLVSKNVADFFVPPLLINTNMMEEARKAGVERYLFASSICIYAPAQVFVEDKAWDGPPHPSTVFAGWAKRMGELQARAYQEQYGWDKIAIVRPVNVYGPYDNFDPGAAQVIPALIGRVCGGENPLKVWGDGTVIRDFLHCRDVARGILLAMEKYACGMPVNLGSGNGYSIREVVEAILEATHADSHVIWDASKPTGEKYRVADISRARKELGFEPEVSLRQGIAETVKWYKENPNFCGLRKN